MKPKPRLLRVNNVPKGIVAPVRKSLVRRMISGTATVGHRDTLLDVA
jgi:hypothetical protein